MNIEHIKIEGLFGELDYDIKFDKNKLILVAENGSGKTTIVNIIYYFLSKQWTKLFRYNFKKISAEINGKIHAIDRDEINVSSLEKVKRYLKKKYSYSLSHTDYMTKKIYEQLLSFDMSDVYRNPGRIEILAERLDLPPQIIYEIANVTNRQQQFPLFDDSFSEKELKMSNALDCQILYLPTFRRIEQDLKVIFPDLEEDIEKYNRRRKRNRNSGEESYVELVEFGMEDVEEKIRTKFSEIRENLNNKIKNNLTGGYLKDIINKTYRETSYEQIQAINEKALSSILDRIDETVLSKNEKSRLLEFVREIKQQSKIDEVENKIVAHFIYRLSKIFDELKEEERDIENFVNICNEYSTNKTFIYDSINFSISIKPLKKGKLSKKDEIQLKDLSSGEKQIVSLFSHLFLSKTRDFFVVIDEPELSLSVPWQQRFLVDIAENPYCKGILAVTHSPFIFENNLEKYAHGLNEFCS